MSEEKMAVIRLLENGTINAYEAERLIIALSKEAPSTDVSKCIGNAIDKFGGFVSSVFQNISHISKEAEPVIKKKVSDFTDRAIDLKQDLKEYRNKKNTEKEEKEILSEDLDESDELAENVYLEAVSKMLNMAENNDENLDMLDMMKAMYSGDEESGCGCGGSCSSNCEEGCGCSTGKSFEDRVVCGREEPCCGEGGLQCKNDEPCCNDENICFKEVHCCGMEEDCGKLSPCCWDDEGKAYAKEVAEQNGKEVGDFIVKNPKNDN